MTPVEQIEYVWKVFDRSKMIGYDDVSQLTVKLNGVDYLECNLEDFLSNYFGDMINPTPEEKVMWRLQFGFDWFF